MLAMKRFSFLSAVFGLLVGCTISSNRVIVVGDAREGALQRAIDAVSAAGGGRVVVPAGVHKSGSLQLKSGVELHLEKGAVILGPPDGRDYALSPDCRKRPGFIQACEADDIAITGEGSIEIDGYQFFDTSSADLWGQFFHPYEGPRPEMLQLHRCRRIRLEGVTFRNSPLWSMHLRLCDDISFENVKVLSDLRFINSDGVDFDGCRRVTVRNCKFVNGDDCIVLRAVVDPGMTEPVVTEDVLVENCELETACQAIRIGCPSDDVIRNATFRNIRAKGRNGIYIDNPLEYLSETDEGRLNVRNILFENFTGEFYWCAVRIYVAPGIDLAGIRDISFKDVDVKSRQPLAFVGNVRSPVEGLSRTNFVLNGKRLEDGPIIADCTNADPLKREPRGSGQATTHPRKDGLKLKNVAPSY